MRIVGKKTYSRLALRLVKDSLDIDGGLIDGIALANDSSTGSTREECEGRELHICEKFKEWLELKRMW